jgi:hypothetical protein
MHPDKRDDRSLFYRCGYLFQLPRGAVDEYELMHNRPVSTYIYQDGTSIRTIPSARRPAASPVFVSS